MGDTLRISWIVAGANLFLGGYIGWQISENPSVYLVIALALGMATFIAIPYHRSRLFAGQHPRKHKLVIAGYIYLPTLSALALAIGSFSWYQPIFPLFISTLFYYLITNDSRRNQ